MAVPHHIAQYQRAGCSVHASSADRACPRVDVIRSFSRVCHHFIRGSNVWERGDPWHHIAFDDVFPSQLPSPASSLSWKPRSREWRVSSISANSRQVCSGRGSSRLSLETGISADLCVGCHCVRDMPADPSHHRHFLSPSAALSQPGEKKEKRKMSRRPSRYKQELWCLDHVARSRCPQKRI